jgi:hypothetical protein
MTDVAPAELLHLPAQLQQLHITAAVNSPEQLALLAGWLAQDTGAVRSLEVRTPNQFADVPSAWVEARASVITALKDALEQHAAGFAHAVPGTAAAAAAAAAAPAGPLVNLQLLSWAGRYLGSAGALLEYVPASSLTQLHCCLDWQSTADIAALCNLTGLRWLALKAVDDGPGPMQQSYQAAGSMLAKLSALQQLTHLYLLTVIHRPQLQQLPQLPRLQQLQAHIIDFGPKKSSQHALKLGHLTALRKLTLTTGRSERVLRPDDTLPPNLQRLSLTGSVGNKWQERDASCHWEPLHLLSKLQHLKANLWPGEPKDTGKLSKLTSLTSLSSVELGTGATVSAGQAVGQQRGRSCQSHCCILLAMSMAVPWCSSWGGCRVCSS